jgi:hypothetical protein
MKRGILVMLGGGLLALCLGLPMSQSARADTYIITRTMPLTTYEESGPCFEERVITSPVVIDSPPVEPRFIEGPMLEEPVIVRKRTFRTLDLDAPLVHLHLF